MAQLKLIFCTIKERKIKMDRNKFSMYWSYYKMIEEKLISTNQYVTHTNDNGKC